MAEYYTTRIPSHARRVFTGEAFDIYQWPQTLYDGSVATFEMAKRHDAASVVAIKGDKIIMLEQEQPLRPLYWSVAAGYIESGETPRDTAARELLEETGLTFKVLKLVEVQSIGDNRLEWYAYRYVAYDIESEVAPQPGPGEKIRVHEMTLEQAQEKAAGNIYASPSVLMKVHSLEELKALPEVQPIV